jgi:hypothetical protein
MQFALLQCHPDTLCKIVRSIQTTVSVASHDVVTVSYTLDGSLEQVRIPDQMAAAVPELWQHTCFELFVGATNDAEYYEFNFSPGGGWALYTFRSYRDGGPIQLEGLDPKIVVQRSTESLQLSAAVSLGALPGVPRGVSLSLGLSAVIEDRTGTLSYWALKHPPGKPDFHHPDNFAVEIELPLGDDRAIEYTAKP